MTTLAAILSTILTDHSLTLAATALLLAMSATFSGCETSLFSLSAPELNRVRASRAGLDRAIVLLHANLNSLLPTLLFCNMGVNVLIFALAASVTAALGAVYGAGAAFAYSLASLFLVVFCGEVFPKQLAIASSLTMARLTAVPVWTICRVLGRPMRVLNAVVTMLERICSPRPADPQELREEELRLLVELSRNDGAISEGEYMMIDSIVLLPEVRIRDVMVPRVDVEALPAGASLSEGIQTARRCGHSKLPVRDARRDDLAGWIDARDIYADHGGKTRSGVAAVESYLREFRYFSEHDRADQVLERIKGDGADLYAVVDERGAVVGFFTLQDIMDEVLGHFGEHGAPPAAEIREMHGGYIISGRLSVREWRDVFNVHSSVPKSATVGGLIVSLLGRIPRVGDRVALDNMEMTVLSTWHNRVGEVGLRLVGAANREKAEKRISSRFMLPPRQDAQEKQG
jgi:CBS domain containing-hemolysin-like protein